MKTKIYIPVSVKDELPLNEVVAFNKSNDKLVGHIFKSEEGNGFVCEDESTALYHVTHWLREIELDIPMDEEIEKYFSVQGYVSIANRNKNEGAKYLREQLLKQLK